MPMMLPSDATDREADPDTDAVLRRAAAVLRDAGVDTPQTDARLLLAHAGGVDLSDIALHALRGTRVATDVAERFAGLVARRAQRVPLQHITGLAHFRRVELQVGPGVFVPRPETELLVDFVLRHAGARADAHLRILDLCTGSGALALALATEIPGASVVGVELSPDALDYARRNVAAHGDALRETGSTCVVVAGDVRAMGDPADDGIPDDATAGPFDVIVSNPPYVRPDEQPDIPEVVDHDPAGALYGGGPDGLELPLRVVDVAARRLGPSGLVVLEHGEGQGAALRDALLRAGLEGARTHADYTGRDRFTSASSPAAGSPATRMGEC